MSVPDSGGLAVYVHWPFCESKCPYCDFNSHVGEGVDQASWRDALLNELDHYALRLEGRRVTSVYFGGGTPSLMEPATTARVIERIGQRWELAEGAEITLEANPTSCEAEAFAGFRAAGVNRLSLGVQALDDSALRFLGRGHDRAEALRALEIAKRLFARVSFDLIYARPGQTLADWAGELAQALSLSDGHLSLYQLTIEKGTPFFAAVRDGAFAPPDEVAGAELYDLTQEMLEAAGLPAYEVSNHAAPGAESRHNLAYWRSEDYLGIGPGAHGRLTLEGETIATRQARRPQDWLNRVQALGHATVEETRIEGAIRMSEVTMMGLRLTEGIPRERFERQTGESFESAFGPEKLRRLAEGGFLLLDEAGLRTSPSGRRVLDALLAELLG